jgi:molybdate transport system substrate-binding protein
MKSFIMIIFFASTLFASSIKVAVAANVSYAIEDLKKAFQMKYPEVQVDVILGSTGKLTAQVMHGAPYQIFMAADMHYPQKLYQNGFAKSEPKVYAQGGLVYISNQERDFSQGMKLLLSPKIEKIAVANPKTAPYGIAAKEALMKAGVYEKIEKKFVYGESISQTLTYAFKVADIGIVAKSSLFSPKLMKFRDKKHYADVNSTLYTPIKQGAVILKEGEGHKDVEAFYSFIFSKKAQDIFQKFGYILP